MTMFVPFPATRRVFLGGLGAAAFSGLARPAFALSLSPAGKKLAAALDALEVEKHWIAGAHVDWETGDPDGRPLAGEGKHTHCSAFVAAAAKRLGVYILRPPEHGQTLLANAQFDWLLGEGPAAGWRGIGDPLSAQDFANRGQLVVASYQNHYENLPGHIAIVRPDAKPDPLVVEEGPQVIQAGARNSSSISMREGFAGHPAAWSRQEARFFTHPLK